jgi:cytochrome P450
VVADIGDELRRREPLPPGELRFSFSRTNRFQRDFLNTMLAYYDRFGPVFSIRSMHRPIVAMIGPDANHFVTVSGAENFSWRKGMFGEQLTPLLGDGLITTDWEYHDRARQIMMPAFHTRRMDSAVAVMIDEATRALDGWRVGEVVDVYHWIRDLSMSIAMRALVGLEPQPDDSGAARSGEPGRRAGGRPEGSIGHQAAAVFERALSFYNTNQWLMLLRGPGSPWARMHAARRELDTIVLHEIRQRRASGTSGDDVLSMLLEARDEEGDGFTDVELRDQLMHLLFGGHDTTSSTFSFLVFELGRHPEVVERLTAELDGELGGRPPTLQDLLHGLPYLSMVVDETLRLYPPVWFGPRMSVKPFEFGGHRVPAGVHIIHSSWVSHRLPEVFPNPEAFIPERFSPEARRKLPRGAYIPFGGGQRICIGKRFGQLVVKAVAATFLAQFGCELLPGYKLHVATMPTLSPDGGLPVTIRPRQPAAARATVPV